MFPVADGDQNIARLENGVGRGIENHSAVFLFYRHLMKRSFLALWVLANATAASVAVGLVWGTAHSGAIGKGVQSILLFFVVPGVFAGATQWLVMRGRMPHANWLVFASAFGWGLGIVLLILIVATMVATGAEESGTTTLLMSIAPGLVSGTVQWLLLRRQVAGSGWWILATTIAFSAQILFFFVVRQGEDLSFAVSVAGGFLSGAGYGLFTGVAIVRVLTNRCPEEAKDSP
jgi:hypothetical protein